MSLPTPLWTTPHLQQPESYLSLTAAPPQPSPSSCRVLGAVKFNARHGIGGGPAPICSIGSSTLRSCSGNWFPGRKSFRELPGNCFLGCAKLGELSRSITPPFSTAKHRPVRPSIGRSRRVRHSSGITPSISWDPRLGFWLPAAKPHSTDSSFR